MRGGERGSRDGHGVGEARGGGGKGPIWVV